MNEYNTDITSLMDISFADLDETTLKIPAYFFTNDTTTGMYYNSNSELKFVVNGVSQKENSGDYYAIVDV